MPVHKVFKKVALVIVGLLFALIFAEVIIRFIPDKIIKIDFNIPRDARIFTTSRVYQFKPNSYSIWAGIGEPGVWRYNNYGFRDSDFTPRKFFWDGKTFRIEMLGDSVTMGLGVDSFESIPARLEKLLQHDKFVSGMNFFEVYNMAIYGYAPPQYDAVFTEVGAKLNPDMVVIGYFQNDVAETITFNKNKKYDFLKSLPDKFIPLRINEFLKNHSHLYLAFLTRYYTYVERFRSPLQGEQDIPKDVVKKGWNSVDSYLKHIIDQAKSKNTQVVIMGIPDPDEIFANSGDTSYGKNLETIAKKYNVPYLDLIDVLRTFPERDKLLWVRKDGSWDVHFTNIGNELVAETLAKFLRDNNLVPSF